MTLHARAVVAVGSRAAIAVLVVLPLGSCAHRQPRSTTLGAPPAPPHQESFSPDYLQRADEALERLRKQLRQRPGESAGRPRRDVDVDAGHPTDADERAPRQPLGTTWSVVVNQPPAPPGDSARLGTPLPSSADGTSDAPTQTRRTFDVVGGAIAALFGTLAIRKRVRDARST